jgi:hypothetical protein
LVLVARYPGRNRVSTLPCVNSVFLKNYESSAAHKESMFLSSGFDIASPKSTAASNSALRVIASQSNLTKRAENSHHIAKPFDL